MMRSSEIEGTPGLEHRRILALRPGQAPDGDRARPRDSFDDRLARLAQRLLACPTDPREDAIHAALETLGLGLDADRVVFLGAVAEDRDLFEQGLAWERSHGKGRLRDALALRIPTGVGQRLRNGEPTWMPARHALTPVGGWRTSSPSPSPLRSPSSPSSPRRGRSRPAGAVWLVPCVGSTGLLGLLAVEVGIAPAHRVRMRLGRSGLVGSLLASFLERCRLADELESRRDRNLRDERLETLGRVASSVAHDLNNVLTAIIGYGELLEMELPDGAPARSELAEIQGAASRATELVDQVLRFGRRPPNGPKKIDLAETVRALSPTIERVLGDRVSLSLDLEDSMPEIRIDPIRLEQVLLNLASNARDAVARSERRRGRFALRSRVVAIGTDGRDPERSDASIRSAPRLEQGAYLRLSARDDGCGIDPSTRARIFEPFF
ncbi:MAG: sensor histidine kinase, partial [bacterium]